jgi:DNA invertase Pin-like site-specific DNA recombinase
MNVIGYVRVSTEEQSKEGVSVDAQIAKIRAYCQLYELNLVDVIVDAGLSAKTLKRAGLQTTLAALRAKRVEGLVVCKLDRLSRSVKDWNTLIDQYFGEKAGKQLFSVGDQIDTRTAAGRLVLNVLMSVAQWEREATGERTRDALAHKKSKGERVGKVPFGYDLAADGVSLVENEQEQRVIGEIRGLRLEGLTLRQIADELSRQGISTKEGNGSWGHQAIARILDRKAA